MHRVSELLRGWGARIVVSEIDVLGLVAVRAPVPLVLAGVCVIHDDAMIAVSVRDVDFVGRSVDEGFGGKPEIVDVVAALALTRLPDLHQELPAPREFQDHAVVEIPLNAAGLALIERSPLAASRAGSTSGAGGLTAAVPANPHIALVVDRNAVIRLGPVVALRPPAPVSDEAAILVELQDRGRGRAALSRRRVRRRMQFAGFERARPVNDPDVILGIDRHSDCLAENPVVRQRLGPQRVHFEPGRHGGGGPGG